MALVSQDSKSVEPKLGVEVLVPDMVVVLVLLAALLMLFGRDKCKFFVDRCCKTRPLSKLYFPTKATFF